MTLKHTFKAHIETTQQFAKKDVIQFTKVLPKKCGPLKKHITL